MVFFAGRLPDAIPSDFIALMMENGIEYHLSKDIEILNKYMHGLANKPRPNAFAQQNQPQNLATPGHFQQPNGPQWAAYPLQNQMPVMQTPPFHPSTQHQAPQHQPQFYGNSFGHPQGPSMQQFSPPPGMIHPHSPANMAPPGAAQVYAHPGYPIFNGNQPMAPVPAPNVATTDADVKDHQNFRSPNSTNRDVAMEQNAMTPATTTPSAPRRSEVRTRNVEQQAVNEDVKTPNSSSNEDQAPVFDSRFGSEIAGRSQRTNEVPDIPDMKPIIHNLAPSVSKDSDDDIVIIKYTPARPNRSMVRVKQELSVDDAAYGAIEQPSSSEGAMPHLNTAQGPMDYSSADQGASPHCYAVEGAPGHSYAPQGVMNHGAMDLAPVQSLQTETTVPQQTHNIVVEKEENAGQMHRNEAYMAQGATTPTQAEAPVPQETHQNFVDPEGSQMQRNEVYGLQETVGQVHGALGGQVRLGQEPHMAIAVNPADVLPETAPTVRRETNDEMEANGVQMEATTSSGSEPQKIGQEAPVQTSFNVINILREAAHTENGESSGLQMAANPAPENKPLQMGGAAVGGDKAENNENELAFDEIDDTSEYDQDNFQEKYDSEDDDYKLPYNHRKTISGLAGRKSGRVSKPPLQMVHDDLSVKKKVQAKREPLEKTFVCLNCSQAFARRGNLMNHLSTVHSAQIHQSRKRKEADDHVLVEQKKQKTNEPLTTSVVQNTSAEKSP